jgi:hypothetical protein
MPRRSSRNSGRNSRHGINGTGNSRSTARRKSYGNFGAAGKAQKTFGGFALPSKKEAQQTLADAGITITAATMTQVLANLSRGTTLPVILAVAATGLAFVTPSQKRWLRAILIGVAVGGTVKALAPALNLNGTGGTGIGKFLRGVGQFLGLGNTTPSDSSTTAKASDMADGFIRNEPRVENADWREIKE